MTEITKELEQNVREQIMRMTNEESPFWSLIGMKLEDIQRGSARITLPFSRKHLQTLGMAHGGVIFSVADSAMGLALRGLLAGKGLFVTAEMKINFLRKFTEGIITADARIIHRGNTTALGEADVSNDKGQLVAKSMATFIITKKRSEDFTQNR